jgi:hypothetical protein
MGCTQIWLGDRAVVGKVGYAGPFHIPAPETYAGIDVLRLNFATVEDTGIDLTADAPIANLHLLMAAALWDLAFAREAGPLSTWSN